MTHVLHDVLLLLLQASGAAGDCKPFVAAGIGYLTVIAAAAAVGSFIMQHLSISLPLALLEDTRRHAQSICVREGRQLARALGLLCWPLIDHRR
jgi:hypothetical protein